MSYEESHRRIEHLLELRVNILCEIELAVYASKEKYWRDELKSIYNELKELGWSNQYPK
jgi:hypothetical protein